MPAPPASCTGIPWVEHFLGGHGQWDAQLPECRTAFSGTLGQGEVCTDDFACSGNMRCTELGGAGYTCEPAVQQGGACKVPEDCDDGLNCAGLQNGTCEPLGGIGDKCGMSDHCQDGLECNASQETCYAAPALGTSCDFFTAPCGMGADCGLSNVCEALGAPGDSCFSYIACQSGACEGSLCVSMCTGGGGGTTPGGLTCEVPGGCLNTDPAVCECFGCTNDGVCSNDEDCVCPDCTNQSYCGGTQCSNNNSCSPYYEGCGCSDCAAHPACQ